MKLRIEGEPAPKGRPRFSVIRGKPHVYTDAKTLAAEEVIRWHLRSTIKGEPDDTHEFFVHLEFVVKSKRCDIDNLTKLVMDAANGFIWKDDKQVVRLLVDLYRTDDASECHTTIEWETATLRAWEWARDKGSKAA